MRTGKGGRKRNKRKEEWKTGEGKAMRTEWWEERQRHRVSFSRRQPTGENREKAMRGLPREKRGRKKREDIRESVNWQGAETRRGIMWKRMKKV